MGSLKPTRPTGLSILALAARVLGSVALFAGLAFLPPTFLAHDGSFTPLPSPDPILLYIREFCLYVISFGAAAVGFSFGAWRVKSWGLAMGIISQLIVLLTAVRLALLDNNFGVVLVAVIVTVPVIIYLLTPDVRNAFTKG
jgi:hypothetical protein